MATPRTVDAGNARRDDGVERCPWCGQPIAREKFHEIKQRIQTEEQRRTAALEQRIRDVYAKQLAEVEAKAESRVNAVRESPINPQVPLWKTSRMVL